MTKIGVVGIGVMGSGIATRLIEAQLEVSVFDLRQEAMEPLITKGAKATSSPAELCGQVDYVVLSLNTAAIVEKAVFGERGLAESATADKLLIDMSSISPTATSNMAERLERQTAMGWVDCPLSGGVPAVAKGALTIMAGGTEANIAKCRTVMNHLAKNFTHMGKVGAGQATKLINQILVANSFATLMESAQLAIAAGIDAERIPQALAGGRADSAVLQEYFVKFAKRDYSPTGNIANMLKDLLTVQEFATASQTSMPVTSANIELHRWLVARGLGPRDSAEMMEYYGSKQVNLDLRP